MKVRRWSQRSVLFFVTILSFLSIVLFYIFFAKYAPGNYTWETSVDASPVS